MHNSVPTHVYISGTLHVLNAGCTQEYMVGAERLMFTLHECIIMVHAWILVSSPAHFWSPFLIGPLKMVAGSRLGTRLHGYDH